MNRRTDPTQIPQRDNTFSTIKDAVLGSAVILTLHLMSPRGGVRLINFLRDDIEWARAVELWDHVVVRRPDDGSKPEQGWVVHCASAAEDGHSHWVPADVDHAAVALIDAWTDGSMSALLARAVEENDLVDIAKHNIDNYSQGRSHDGDR